jgi:hypothetical protein
VALFRLNSEVLSGHQQRIKASLNGLAGMRPTHLNPKGKENAMTTEIQTVPDATRNLRVCHGCRKIADKEELSFCPTWVFLTKTAKSQFCGRNWKLV